MSLLGTQGGRTNEKNIKEILLNQQIVKLRQILQDSSAASEKVLILLRKIIAFKREAQKQPRDESAILHQFLEDLSSIEDSFIALIENCQADKEQFVSSVIFRDSEKQLNSIFFRKMMKNHQEFKEHLNLSILRLQKDIQTLETNGFHIYSTVLKPNNVLSNLKKNSLDKFIVSLGEMGIVFAKMKASMNGSLHLNKKTLKTDFKNEVQKIKQYCRYAEQIFLKEKLRNIMMIEEINKVRSRVATENKKIRIFEEAIKKNKKSIKSIGSQIIVHSEELHKGAFQELIKSLKESVDAHMIFTPKLYKAPSMRSKSCHALVTVQERMKQMKENEQSGFSSQITIIGGDFLEESMQS